MRKHWKLALWVLAVIAFVMMPVLVTRAADARARAAVAVSISRVHVAQARPVLPSDFERQSATPVDVVPESPPQPVIDPAAHAGLERLTLEQGRELVDLDRELRNAGDKNRSLSEEIAKLASELMDLKAVKALPPVQLAAVEFGELSLELARPAMATPGAVAGEVYYVKVLTQESCPPCVDLQKATGDLFTHDGATVHLDWIDVVNQPELVPPQYRGRHILTPLVLFYSPKHGDMFLQSPTKPDIVRMLRKWQAEKHDATTAIKGVGGSFRTGGRIQAALDAWDAHLGRQSEVTLQWDRSGLQSLSATKLIHGEPWTERMVCGSFGHVSLGTTSTQLPGGLQAAGFTYRLLPDNRRLFDPDPFVLSFPESQPVQGLVAGAPEVSGIDPVTLGLTLVQVADALYQILNPQIDIGLGGSVTLTAKRDGDKLVVLFNDCPSIHVSAWFKFDLDVERVELSTTNVHVAFKPQPRNWIRIDSRDFPVNDQ